jgi:hypothetical protein
LGGFNDIFMTFLEDHSTGMFYPAMTDGQRVTASTNTGNLHWVGANVAAMSSLLSAGKTGTHVHLYAPSTQQAGSSVSHWDTSLTPDELMEPYDTGSTFAYMTDAAFDDMGWAEFPIVTPTPTLSATPTPTATPTVTPTPTCGSAPEAGCRTPAIGLKAFLYLKDDATDDSKDKLIWKWIKGSATSKIPDFGTPLSSTSYLLCLYDATGLLSSAVAPPGGICNVARPGPCWQEKTTSFKYKDKDLTPEGLLQVLLKEGEVEKAKIIVIGKGLNLDMPTMPLTQPVTVQIKNTEGVCWEAKYSGICTNNEMGPPGKFKCKAD